LRYGSRVIVEREECVDVAYKVNTSERYKYGVQDAG